MNLMDAVRNGEKIECDEPTEENITAIITAVGEGTLLDYEGLGLLKRMKNKYEWEIFRAAARVALTNVGKLPEDSLPFEGRTRIIKALQGILLSE
jgi:hypothetical protein